MKGWNQKIELLARTPVPKALLAMGLPIMLGMMINALYNLADAYFVGRLGTNQMGAITAVFPLGQLMVGLGLLFGNGAASYLSRLLGSGDRQRADQAASTALYSSLLTSAAVIIGIELFMKPILGMLGAGEEVMPYALIYARIYIPVSLFNVFNVTMNNLVSSEGAAKMTMGVLATGAALNVLLDPVFIYILDMGVSGAAIATAISQAISALLYIGYILSKKSLFCFSVKACCFSKDMMREILKIGIPTLLFQALTSLSIALINAKAAEYGASILSAMGAVTRVMSMGSLMVFGFLKGFQPIAGYSYGAGNYERLGKVVKLSILWSTGFCVIYGLAAAFFSEGIISEFTEGDPEMIRAGQEALRANGVSFLVFGFYTVYSCLFLALGKARAGLALGACRQGLCFLPVIAAFPALWGVKGIFFAQPAADFLSAVITVFMAFSLHKELSRRERGRCGLENTKGKVQ